MKIVLTLTAVLALAACSGRAARQDQADPLADTAWTLDALPGLTLTDGVEVTLRFQEGRIGGSAGCNTYFASYAVTGDSLKIGPAGATKMMCPEPQMAAEGAFFAALAQVRTFRLENGRLVLVAAEGQAMGFVSTPIPAEQR